MSDLNKLSQQATRVVNYMAVVQRNSNRFKEFNEYNTQKNFNLTLNKLERSSLAHELPEHILRKIFQEAFYKAKRDSQGKNGMCEAEAKLKYQTKTLLRKHHEELNIKPKINLLNEEMGVIGRDLKVSMHKQDIAEIEKAIASGHSSLSVGYEVPIQSDLKTGVPIEDLKPMQFSAMGDQVKSQISIDKEARELAKQRHYLSLYGASSATLNMPISHSAGEAMDLMSKLRGLEVGIPTNRLGSNLCQEISLNSIKPKSTKEKIMNTVDNVIVKQTVILGIVVENATEGQLIGLIELINSKIENAKELKDSLKFKRFVKELTKARKLVIAELDKNEVVPEPTKS